MPWTHPTGLLVDALANHFTVPERGWGKLPQRPSWYDNEQYLFQFVGEWDPPDLSGGFLWVRRRFMGKVSFVGRSVRYYLKRDYQLLELPIAPAIRERGYSATEIEVCIGGRKWMRKDNGETLLPQISVWELAGY